MKQLVFKGQPEDPHYTDIDRIVRVCRQVGLHIDRTSARLAWEAYSDSMAAGWLRLPDSDLDLLLEIKRRCLEVEKE